MFEKKVAIRLTELMRKLIWRMPQLDAIRSENLCKILGVKIKLKKKRKKIIT